ncbi:MAG: DUF1801 domain-containing protein [Tepidisphaera sp.]
MAKKPRSTTASKAATGKSILPRTAAPKLLAGGNPQIAKGLGEEPVQAYLAAMPGWKQAVGRLVDRLVGKAVPGVRKAVKWNSPLYGSPDEEGTWFMSMHCFDKYVKIAFFRGAMLTPIPPGASKQRDVRYLDVHEEYLRSLDEELFISWVQQASRLPGECM